MNPINIGTCGWSYADWKGHFYPENAKDGDMLSLYAEQFPVVEVDSTFYRSPSLKMVQGWDKKTPAGFRFSLKVPQIVTHEKILVDCDEEMDGFLAAAEVLGEKLLCAVLQFGYFNRSAFSSQAAFLDRLDPFLARFAGRAPLAVEVRNKAWMNAELASCLRAHQVSWVLPDQAWMPMPLDILKKIDAVTGPLGYVRLLGDRKAVDDATDTLSRIVVDRIAQIEQDARAIVQLSARVPVLVFVNNHFAGYAPGTIRQLIELIEREKS